MRLLQMSLFRAHRPERQDPEDPWRRSRRAGGRRGGKEGGGGGRKERGEGQGFRRQDHRASKRRVERDELGILNKIVRKDWS